MFGVRDRSYKDAGIMSSDPSTPGHEMYELLRELFPICRSITGNGVRQTLAILQRYLPIKLCEVRSGTRVFDWIVPNEWNIRSASIEDEKGKTVIDFKENNLHVVGYSTPVDQWMGLAELQPHLHSLEDQPEAIPYVTSYYKDYWGFCLKHTQRTKLPKGKYHVVIDSDLKPGSLTYGELILPGKTKQEIFLSTYICHPSMANNELSGPIVTTFLARWIASTPRQYTYRIIFIPETIGSLTYLSRNLAALKKNVVAGFNISCIGDERTYSFLPSRYGDTLADKAALNVLSFMHPNFTRYTFLDRGSDERQYCSPGVDLPLVTLSRSKYGAYPEYHTSLDDLNFVTPNGLQGSLEFLQNVIQALEQNTKYQIQCLGEPQLGKRGLYPTTSTKKTGAIVKDMMNFLAYADGTNDLIDISNRIRVPVWELDKLAKKFVQANLLRAK